MTLSPTLPIFTPDSQVVMNVAGLMIIFSFSGIGIVIIFRVELSIDDESFPSAFVFKEGPGVVVSPSMGQ